MSDMKRSLAAILVSAPLLLATGYLLSEVIPSATPSANATLVGGPIAPPVFHDLRVNSINTYVDLIEPENPEVVKLARRFKTYEEAYHFVSEKIGFAPFVPPGPVHETLRHGVGSCLGKAVLLCSIYRAMGLQQDAVRVVLGLVITPDGIADHVWLDLEYQGRCLQQDPSGMFGHFAFDAFPGNGYVVRYVMKESFCFNDAHFAIVSQLNRLRNTPR